MNRPSIGHIDGVVAATTQTIETVKPRSGRWRVAVGLIVLMVGVISLSLLVLSRQSLRLDEAQSLWQSSHSVGRLLNIIAQDVHVPLYHLLLHFVQVLVGNSVLVGRLLSVTFFVLTIPVFYRLARLLYDSRTSLFATLLLAISPFMNWYANEIRMYSLLTFITVVNQYAFIKLYQAPNRRHWWLYGLTAVLGIYSHYFFGLVLLGQALFYGYRPKNWAAGSWKRLQGVGGVVVLAILPWVMYVQGHGGSVNTQPLLERPTSVSLFNTFNQFLFGFHPDRLSALITSLWPLVLLLLLLALRKQRRLPLAVGYFLIALVLPVVLTFTASLTVRPVYVSRYLILILPSLYLLLAGLFVLYPTRLSRWLKGFLVLSMIIGLSFQIGNARTPVKEDYQAASQYLAQESTPSDIILVSVPFTIYPVEYYYQGAAELRTLPNWDRTASGAIPAFSVDLMAQELKQVAHHQTLWVLLSYDQGYEQQIKDYLDSHYQRLTAKEFSPDLNLYAYQLRYDPPVIEQLLNPPAQ